MKMTNQTACMGESIKMRNAPIAVPINAPKIGIRAVKPTSTEIIGA